MADSEKSSSGENEQKNETITESSDEQATAMEVEGDPKELKIIHVFEHAAEKCIDKCLNASKMARCCSEIRKNNKEMVDNLFEQAVIKMKKNIHDELQSIMDQENMQPCLSELQRLYKQSQNKPQDYIAWRPSGNPEDDTRAHIVAKKEAILESLERKLELVKKDEEDLKEKVKEKRDQLAAVMSKVESIVHETKTISEAFRQFGVENSEIICSSKEKFASLSQALKANGMEEQSL